MKRFCSTVLLILVVWLCVTACSRNTEPEPPKPEPKKIRWMIFDDSSGGSQSQLNGAVINGVFEALPVQPEIEYYTDNQDVAVSRMLSLRKMPGLITVPAGSALRQKVLASGDNWNIKTLSEELWQSIPEEIRAFYQNNNGELFSVPGGYEAGDFTPVCAEGMYVREEYYGFLGAPSMNTTEKFKQAVNSFVELVTKNNLLNSDEVVPVTFGVDKKGLRTAEHIFGVRPFYKEDGRYYHRIFSPAMREVTRFFERLDTSGANRIFSETTPEGLNELLKRNVFVYIGESDFIERFSLSNPRQRFVRVDPPFAPGGYLESQSRFGKYETFISRSADRETAAKLLLALSSEKASLTLIYGQEDEHWIHTEGKPTPVKNTLSRIENDMEAFVRQTGIGRFPFLSRTGLKPAYWPGERARALDISQEKGTFFPSDYDGYSVTKIDERLEEYYSELVNTGTTAADIIERIRLLAESKTPLTVT